jgi:hypothetical protein
MLASCRNANLLVFPSSRVHSEQSVQSVVPSHSILKAEKSQTKWTCGNASTATAQPEWSSLDHIQRIIRAHSQSSAVHSLNLKIGLTIRAVVRLGRDNVSK